MLTTNKELNIAGKWHVREKSFIVYHHEWELDGKVWIAREMASGKKVVIATNHGSYYVTDRSAIDSQIKQSMDHIEEMRAALELLE